MPCATCGWSTPEVADEECRLRRRGESWQLVPSRTSRVRLDGRAVAGPQPLPFGVPFQVGGLRLTLQPAAGAGLAWAATPIPPPTARPAAPGPEISPAAGKELADRHRQEWGPTSEGHDRWLRSHRETKRWESRFRAAGEKLRAGEHLTVPPVSAPASPPAPIPTVAPTREVNRSRTPLRGDLARETRLRPTPTPVAPPPVPVPPAAPLPAAAPAPVRPADWSRLVPGPVAPAPHRHERPVDAVRVPEPTLPSRRPTVPEPTARLDWPLLLALPAPEQAAPHGSEGPSGPDAPNAGDDSRAATENVPADVAAPDVVEWEPRSHPAPVAAFDVEARRLAGEEDTTSVSPIPESLADVASGSGGDEECSGFWDEVDLDAEALSAAADPPESPEVEVDLDDDLDHGDDEPTGRPVLGSTRRVERTRSAVVDETGVDATVGPAEPIIDSSFRDARTEDWRHNERRPVAEPRRSSDDRPEWEAADDRGWSEHGGWGCQAPFITDTHSLDPVDPFGAAVGVATGGAGRSGARARRPSRPGRETWRGGANLGVEREPVGRPAVESRGPRESAREWPTVADILAARGAGRGSAAAPVGGARAKAEARPEPTRAVEPGQWRLPLWLGWLPAAVATAGFGGAGLVAAWTWTQDGYNAGVVARRLAADAKAEKPLPRGVVPGGGHWWETTAAHLVTWAAYRDRTADDPGRAEEVRALLTRAAEASPLNPTVRYAVARVLPGDAPPPERTLALGLGQSRDVVSLTLAGRRLVEAGRKGAALGAYRAALALAAEADPARPEPPTFLDDAQPKRYAVPTEERLAAVIRDMAESSAWAYPEWSAALPRGTAAALAAARVLRERSSPDADAALAAAVAEAGSETPAATPHAEAVRLAAGAAALAAAQRWGEARDRYRRAIDVTPVEAARRAWWLNVADVALRLNEESERRSALDSAKNSDPKDEITVRAVELQKSSGFVAQRGAARPPDGAAAAGR